MILAEIVPDQIWHAIQPVKLGPLECDTRMTIVRLPDRTLWVHSPIRPRVDLLEAIDALGPVSHVVAPNCSHLLYFRPFLAAFPEASGHVPPGLAARRPEFACYPEIATHGAAWSGVLDGIFIGGLPALNETVWHHRSSGTLILADLLACIGQHASPSRNLIARLLGVHERLAMSRTMRLLIKDKAALARSITMIRSLEVRRIIVAHDSIIEADAPAHLSRALAWIDG